MHTNKYRRSGAAVLCAALALTVDLTAAAKADPFAYVGNSGDNTVTVIDTATKTVVGSPIPVGHNPHGVAVAPDAKHVFVPNLEDNSVSVIDAATRTVVATVAVGEKPVGITVAPDGKRVYVGNVSSHSISVIDASNPSYPVVTTIGSVPSPFWIDLTPDGKRLYAVNANGNTVAVVNVATPPYGVVATVTVGAYPYGIAVSPDGKRAYTANLISNDVSVIDTATNTLAGPAIPTREDRPSEVVVRPDGKFVYVSNIGTGSGPGSVSVIDAATNVITATIYLQGEVRGIAVTPDGKFLYVANNQANFVSVIDTATNALVATVPAGVSPTRVGIVPPPGGVLFYDLNVTNAMLVANAKQFLFKSTFTVSSAGNGINPATETVRLMVGPYMTTIPAGAFVKRGRLYGYDGVIDGVRLRASFLAYGNLQYAFGVHARGANVRGATNPVPVSFSIGDDAGRTTVTIPNLGR